MTVLGGRRAREDLTNEVDDGIRTSTQLSDDLELCGETGAVVLQFYSDSGWSERVTLQKKAFADEVSGCEDVLDDGRGRGRIMRRALAGGSKGRAMAEGGRAWEGRWDGDGAGCCRDGGRAREGREKGGRRGRNCGIGRCERANSVLGESFIEQARSSGRERLRGRLIT